MSFVHRGTWVLPMAGPPIKNGFLAVENGHIVGVGAAARAGGARAGGAPDVAILPGLVNAHTHLELSWMKGLVPPGDSMPAWAGRLIDLRMSSPAGGRKPIIEAIASARASGTELV